MFLFEDSHQGAKYLVFIDEDPRPYGRFDNVIEDVALEYDVPAVHDWPSGQDAPEACVGRAAHNPRQFKVFKYRRDLVAAGYEPIDGSPVMYWRWPDYLRLHHPELLSSEAWFDYLDDIDAGARHRRENQTEPNLTGKSRDEVAAWLARQHFSADSGIREVWYLPRGAPPDEIRLLETNDRLGPPGSNPEPIDFGLDIEGAGFRLFVADVTSDQLNQIEKDPSRLPPGWSLEGRQVWPRRRGA